MDLLLRRFLSQFIRRGTMTVTGSSGSKFTVGDGTGEPVAVRFVTAEAERKILVNPELGLGDAYMDRFNASSLNQGAVGVSVGLAELRKVMNEDVFEAGNLYGLLSASNEGKTSLTIQIMLSALNAGHPVLFLSYDQSQSQCVAQMIAQMHGIDSKQQKNPQGLMSQWEQDQSISFATWLNTQPIDIIRCGKRGHVGKQRQVIGQPVFIFEKRTWLTSDNSGLQRRRAGQRCRRQVLIGDIERGGILLAE